MAHDDGLSPQLDAFLSVRKLIEDTGMSADDVLRMDMQDYRRLRRNSGLPDIDLFKPSQPAAESRSSAPAGDSLPSNSVTPTSLPEGITDEQFLAWRAQRGNQGEGRGIFSSVSSQSQAYQQAAARQAGRNAMITSNVSGPAVPATREQVAAAMRQSEQARLQSGRRQYYAGS